jgi:hypothetical protein
MKMSFMGLSRAIEYLNSYLKESFVRSNSIDWFFYFVNKANEEILSYSRYFSDLINMFEEPPEELLKAYDMLSQYYYGTFKPVIHDIEYKIQFEELKYDFLAEKVKMLLNDLVIIRDTIYGILKRYEL